ncbi:unnamed protein product [Euphydryas editha]|uniref:Uncharacterized protein n=1 Tax=Euphydryas editha TaxID=104508 RepID=A0AAU9TXQ6_EUPED|nr:unnamed protein product [Euphydryas editha]
MYRQSTVFWKCCNYVNSCKNFRTGLSSSSVTGTVTRVSSVVGGEADLPCDSSPPQRNDSLLLVVWYRDDNPVYRYVLYSRTEHPSQSVNCETYDLIVVAKPRTLGFLTGINSDFGDKRGGSVESAYLMDTNII